jgi:uncharacterized protein (TIGR00369 family)
MTALTPEAFAALCAAEAPFAELYGFQVERLAADGATVRLPWRPALLRPGGTVAGPALMALADFAVYAALLARIGRVPLAVTTNLSINFLRKPGAGDLLAEAGLLKLGKRLAVGEVTIAPAAGGEPVAHAVATYSIPPEGPPATAVS